MAWPDTSLVGEVCLQLAADLTVDPTGYAFATDITSLTFDRDGDSSIVIRRGRTDEQSVAQPSTCTLSVNNTDGRFSARNPVGTYYPGLRRNTPLRVRVNPGTGLATRYVGFVSEWPPRWDVREKDHNVPVRADGVLRRLTQGATPLKSAMFRRITSPDEPTPAAYWPCEDGSGATSVASGLPGGSPMVGVPIAGSGFGGSAGSIDLSAMADEVVSGSVALASTSGFQLECMAQSTSGLTEQLLEIVCGTFDTTLALSNTLADGLPHHLSVQFVQNGANVDFTTYHDGVLSSTGSIGGVLSSFLSLFQRGQEDATTLLAQIAVYNFADIGSPATRAAAADGYDGELAHVRFARLCAEENVPADVDPQSTEQMGPQGTGTLVELLRECEAADESRMQEQIDGRLGFFPRAVRENETVALTLNYASKHVSPPFEPTDDDQLIRNDVTVTRTGGSKSQVVDTTGPVGVTAVGRYDEGVELNLFDDTQPYNHAGWRVNLGTADGLRFPTVTVNLRRNNSLTASFLALDIGSRIKITNLPDIISFDDLDLIIEGYTEQISQKNWIITFNLAPYRPYKVFVLANTTSDTGEFLGRLDWDSCVLAEVLDTTETGVDVSVIPSITTAADDFPLTVMVGGERLTVASCAASVTDTFTRSVSNAWGTLDTGQSWTLSTGTAADFSVSGGRGNMSHSATLADHSMKLTLGVVDVDVSMDLNISTIATPTGGDIVQYLDARMVDANNLYRLYIRTTTTSTVTATLAVVVGGVQTTLAGPLTLPGVVGANNISTRIQIVGSSIRAKAWLATLPEPLNWTLTATDTQVSAAGDFRVASFRDTGNTNNPTVFLFDLLSVTSLQTLTVTRSVNGVVKTHASGESLTIDEPMVLAL